MSDQLNESTPVFVGTLKLHVSASENFRGGVCIEIEESGLRYEFSNPDPVELTASTLSRIGQFVWNEGRSNLLETIKKEVR